MLHDGRDDGVAWGELQTVGEVVDRLGRVPADDGDVVAPVAPGKAESSRPGALVGLGCELGLATGPAMNARVSREELFDSLQDISENPG